MNAKAHADAVTLLEGVHAFLPQNDSIALLLATAAASAGHHRKALDALAPLAGTKDATVAVLARAAELNFKLGSIEESVHLHRRAAALEAARAKGLISVLLAAGRGDEALSEARKAMQAATLDPALLLTCFNVLSRLSNDDAEIAAARARALANIPDGAEGALVRARIYRSEGDLESALGILNSALTTNAANAPLLKERASVVLALGYWGRDAKLLQESALVLGDAPDLRARMSHADDLLTAFGSSLADAARSDEFAHVMSPESVFAHVAQAPRESDGAVRSGLVMIAHSLIAGGAERIVAETFRALHASKRFGWVKLYLMDLSHGRGADFYLPLVGSEAAADIVVLDRAATLEPPFAWLPIENAATAQTIFNQLRKDRPAIVHASLEPLTLLAGLAALSAGAPRIVLHTHNMRPTALYPEAPAPRRWQGCYEALLSRKDVALVGVANAAIRDYESWLDLPADSNLHVLHNGFDAGRFAPVRDPAKRALLRARFDVSGDAPLVGTAFKFRQEKRPLLWVDAACRVLEKFPACRFVMFGDGALLEPTRTYIAEKGVAASFVLPGLVRDIEHCMPALDLFVLSSASEALPNVLLEAQACGVPVIARHVGGIAETMADGVTGMLVEDDTAQALGDAIARAIADPAWRAAAAVAGEAFVRERFSPARMIADLTDILLASPEAAA